MFLTSNMGHSMEKVSQNCSAQGFDIKCCIRLAVSYRPVNSAHSLGVILRPLSRAWISPPVKRGYNCCECLELRYNLQHYSVTHIQPRAKRPVCKIWIAIVFWSKLRYSNVCVLPANMRALTHSARPCIAAFIKAVKPWQFLLSMSSPGK